VLDEAGSILRLDHRRRPSERVVNLATDDGLLRDDVRVSAGHLALGVHDRRIRITRMLRIHEGWLDGQVESDATRPLAGRVLGPADNQRNHVGCAAYAVGDQHRLIGVGQPEAVGATHSPRRKDADDTRDGKGR